MIRRFIRHPEALMLVAFGVSIAALLVALTLTAAALLGWLVPAAI